MGIMEEYRSWLERFSFDRQTAEELKSIAGLPAEIEDRFYTELAFGTAGMRGVIGAGTNRMNRYTVRRASAGLADLIRELPGMAARGVVVAYDSRRFSPEFARETALVLAARGVRAFLFDALRPVPVLSFAVRHLKAAAGVAITASHNPPRYNGFKVYWEDGAQLSPEMAEAVTARIRALRYEDCLPMDEGAARKRGLLSVIGSREVDDDYVRMVLSLSVNPALLREEGGRLSIVYTPLHGSGNVPVRRTLREAGILNVTVVPEQEAPDPDFPTVSAPNPEDPGAFALAIPLAQKIGASVIFGTDPDCDRLGVCVRDAGGVYRTLTGNQIGCLLLHHILSEKKRSGALPPNGAVVKSIVTTELSRAICAAFGVALFDTLTGFKFIGEKIQGFEESGSHRFLFGFEESFGYLSGTAVRDKDGVNASLLIAEAACACAREGITLYDRLQRIYREYGFWCERVVSTTLPGREGLANMKAIMRRLRDDPPRRAGSFEVAAVRDYLTGVRREGGKQEAFDTPPSDVLYFELAGGHWFCVRPSGTEPKIKLYVNTCARDSMESAERLNAALADACAKLLR